MQENRIKDILSRIEETNIDPRSLLSTDYFNHFNEVIMMIGLLADMPEILDEIENWKFKSYCEHFKESSLSFAPLAIEAYELAPNMARQSLDNIAESINNKIISMRHELRQMCDKNEKDKIGYFVLNYTKELQSLIDRGNAIVHGSTEYFSQQDIDKIFL